VGDLARRESREAFRKLIDEAVDGKIKQRVWQLVESVVFSEDPVLRGLERFEVRSGSGAPTVTEYPKDGLGVWVDGSADEIYLVLKWRNEFYFVGGSGTSSLPAVDYAYVTESDPATDVTAEELEELSDGSETDLHIHDDRYYTETEIDAEFLDYALIDGSRAFTGEVTFEKAIILPIYTQTGPALTLTEDHFTVLGDTTSNTVTITLPTAVGNKGRIYNIKCIDDTNACELAADGTEEIDGSTANIPIALMETISVQSDNANWWITL